MSYSRWDTFPLLLPGKRRTAPKELNVKFSMILRIQPLDQRERLVANRREAIR
jgi:hypothetical protein